jgi:uncharacterized protein (TIGR02001 family)
MKRILPALAVLATAAVPSVASAQAAAPAASPLTGNVTITSDYRFRGLSQSFKLPAVQGGIDWAHASGFYLGNWNSSVSGNQYPNGASLEMDFYGGYKFPVGKDVVVDVGGLYFYYPGAFFNGFSPDKPKFDHFELYVGATMGPLSGKLFYGLTNFFGLDGTVGGRDSKGATYVDLNYSSEIIPKVTLGLHIGYQYVPNYSNFDYFDYKVGVTYDWTGWLLGAAVVGTNADKAVYFATDGAGKTKTIGGTGVVFSIGKTF